MATCVKSIELAEGKFEELYPATLTPFSINILKNQLFKISVITASQAVFQFALYPTIPVIIVNVTVTIFRVVGTGKDQVLTDMGSAVISDLIGGYSKDFAIGEYIMCIRSNQSYSATVVGQFGGFVPQTNIGVDFSDGVSVVGEFDNRRPPMACDEPLYFEMTDGELPPGIQMTGLGRLYGTLPNLDCLEDSQDFSPGQNWSYADTDGIMHPWGRVWRFKVRVSLADMPESNDNEWFCVRVHNNWDFDRDNFLRNAPFKTVGSIVITEEPKKLPETLCFEPCIEPIKTSFVPQPIGAPTCPVCDDADAVTDIQLIAIPPFCQNIDVSLIPLWWTQNRETIFECKETKRFMDNLKESAYFNALLRQSGYLDEAPDPRTVIEATAFRNFMQLSATTLIGGRADDHIDSLMLKWKNEQNQRLPTSAMAWDGIAMEVNLK